MGSFGANCLFPVKLKNSSRELLALPQSSDQLDFWFSPLRFTVALFLLLFAAYPGIFLGTESFFFRDYGVLSYPTIFYQRERFWNGELPLWNPLSNCGVPFLAQWGAMTLYPLSLFYLLLPLPWSLGVFCLGHVLLAGLGMYFLAHAWTGNRFAAWTAGLMFAFNGVIFSSLAWPNYTVAICWMPWLVLFAERGWTQGGKQVFTAALVGTMQMLSGVPEIILLTWFLIGVLWGIELFRGQDRWRVFYRLLMVMLLVAGLSAAQLLPFIDLLLHSQRDSNFGTSGWSMPGWGWASFLVPLFHCARSPQGMIYQPKHVFLISYYLGVATMALAVLGALSVRQVRVWVLSGCALLSLIMALGDQGILFSWLKVLVPGLGFARFPIKFIYLGLLTIPLLAGYGTAWLEQNRGELWKKATNRLLLVWEGSLAIIAGLLWFAYTYRFATDLWPDTGINTAVRVAFFTAIVGILRWSHTATSPLLQGVLKMTVGLAFCLDIATHAPNQAPVLSAKAFTPNIIEASSKPAFGASRAMISPAAEDRLYRSRVPDYWKDFIGKRLGLWSNLNLLENVARVDGATTLQLRPQAEVQTRLFEYSDSSAPRIMDFLAVSHISDSENPTHWITRSNYLPFITIGQKPMFVAVTNSLSQLFQPSFNPQAEVLLPQEAQMLVKAERCKEAKVLEQTVSNERLQAKVATSQPAMLVVAQSFYHHWRAYVDGVPVRLWKANHAFQALEVPAGNHQIELRYEDSWFRVGLLTSLCSLLVAMSGWYYWLRKARLQSATLQ